MTERWWLTEAMPTARRLTHSAPVRIATSASSKARRVGMWRFASRNRTRVMSSKDLVDLYEALGRLGVQIWVDGGWGVDALLGKQTRPHKGLDIAIEAK